MRVGEGQGQRNIGGCCFLDRKGIRKYLLGLFLTASRSSLIYLSPFIQQIFVEYLLATILTLIKVLGVL